MEKRMTPSGGIERCHDEGSGMIIVDSMVMFKSDNVANQEGTQDEVREAGLAIGEWYRVLATGYGTCCIKTKSEGRNVKYENDLHPGTGNRI
eukprot:scaffold7862_cov133-Chaetoceros_neogracile.AAC.1